MGKKCIPGLFCIENMTLFLLIVVFVLLLYLWHTQIVKPMQEQSKIIVVNTPTINDAGPITSLSTRNNPFTDPYSPPLKSDGIPIIGDLRGNIPLHAPINIETRGLNTGYQQVGILTRSSRSNDDNMILPVKDTHKGCNDRICISKPKNILYYGKLYDKLLDYSNKKSIVSEVYLLDMLKEENIKIKPAEYSSKHFCELCSVITDTFEILQIHLNSDKHLQKSRIKEKILKQLNNEDSFYTQIKRTQSNYDFKQIKEDEEDGDEEELDVGGEEVVGGDVVMGSEQKL